MERISETHGDFTMYGDHKNLETDGGDEPLGESAPTEDQKLMGNEQDKWDAEPLPVIKEESMEGPSTGIPNAAMSPQCYKEQA